MDTEGEATPLLLGHPSQIVYESTLSLGGSPFRGKMEIPDTEYSQLSDLANHIELSLDETAHTSISTKFESLDYDICENRPYKYEQQSYTAKKLIKINLLRWIVMAIIGVITASIAFVVNVSVDMINHWKFDFLERLIRRSRTGSVLVPQIVWIALDVAFVMVAVLVTVYMEPVAAGGGIAQIKCFLNGVKIPNVVRIKTLFVKVIGAILAISGGLAVGKEGPMVHIGAVVAAGVSQGRSTTFRRDLHIFKEFRSDHEKRDFVAGGAAAGVSAAFGAPVGGLLFSLEEGASFWSKHLTWRIFFASLISTFFVNMLSSIYSGNAFLLSFPGLVNFGQFHGAYERFDIPIFIIMAVVGGILGAFFNYVHEKLSVYRKMYLKHSYHRVLEAIVITSVTTGIMFCLIYFLPLCKPAKKLSTVVATGAPVPYQCFCEDGQVSGMGLLAFNHPEKIIKNLFHADQGDQQILTVVVFFAIYFLLAMWTLGVCVPSGLFVPLILLGAVMGRIIGEFLPTHFPNMKWGEPGVFALMGSACMMGGVFRMTVSLCVMLMEGTGNITLGLPLMLCLIVAKWVGDFFNEGIYEIQILQSGVPFLDCDTPQMACNIPISKVMNKNVVCFNMLESVGRIVDVLKDTSSHHNGFPVVTEAQNCPIGTYGIYQGIILRSQLITLLKKKAFSEDGKISEKRSRLTLKDFRDAYPRFPPIRNINISTKERECFLDLQTFMNPAPYTIYQNSSLDRVFRLFRALGLRHVVVVNATNQVVGMVTRKDLALYRTWSHRGQMGLHKAHIREDLV